jgi:hypothetical protein
MVGATIKPTVSWDWDDMFSNKKCLFECSDWLSKTCLHSEEQDYHSTSAERCPWYFCFCDASTDSSIDIKTKTKVVEAYLKITTDAADIFCLGEATPSDTHTFYVVPLAAVIALVNDILIRWCKVHSWVRDPWSCIRYKSSDIPWRGHERPCLQGLKVPHQLFVTSEMPFVWSAASI